MIRERAPAKINLYLHVGGVRSDGLHALASLFVFADIGDDVSVLATDDGSISLQIEGPFSTALADFDVRDNLVYRAALLLREATGKVLGTRMVRHTALPGAAGIGGGSADAAAAIKALNTAWSLDLDGDALAALAFRLGADVPACLHKAPIFVAGAGEVISPAPSLPRLFICLVNPGVATPTGPIFKAFDTANPAPDTPAHPALTGDDTIEDFLAKLSVARNDLQPPAVALVPAIAQSLDFLSGQSGCCLARMSGSGATCFGLFMNPEEAQSAADRAVALGWWAKAGRVLDADTPSNGGSMGAER